MPQYQLYIQYSNNFQELIMKSKSSSYGQRVYKTRLFDETKFIRYKDKM